jgi:hypothetical protein
LKRWPSCSGHHGFLHRTGLAIEEINKASRSFPRSSKQTPPRLRKRRASEELTARAAQLKDCISVFKINNEKLGTAAKRVRPDSARRYV